MNWYVSFHFVKSKLKTRVCATQFLQHWRLHMDHDITADITPSKALLIPSLCRSWWTTFHELLHVPYHHEAESLDLTFKWIICLAFCLEINNMHSGCTVWRKSDRQWVNIKQLSSLSQMFLSCCRCHTFSYILQDQTQSAFQPLRKPTFRLSTNEKRSQTSILPALSPSKPWNTISTERWAAFCATRLENRRITKRCVQMRRGKPEKSIFRGTSYRDDLLCHTQPLHEPQPQKQQSHRRYGYSSTKQLCKETPNARIWLAGPRDTSPTVSKTNAAAAI